jgi:hypothetical protein
LKFCTELDAAAFPVAADAPAVVVRVLAGGVAATVFDPLAHAVADAATRMRLAAANTLDTRMSFSDEVVTGLDLLPTSGARAS